MGTIAPAWLAGPAQNRAGASLGLDFIAFYTAGTFVREGRTGDLYDLSSVKQFEHALAVKEGIALSGDAIGPWWNPPFYAWVFVPLSRMGYPVAVRAWIGINVLCAAVALAMLCRMLGARLVAEDPSRSRARGAQFAAWPLTPALSPGYRGEGAADAKACNGPLTYALVPVLLVLSVPFIHSITHGQNSCTSLLLVTAIVMLWRKEKAFGAGIAAGLLFYKPQLAAVVAAVLVLDLGWRALAGICATGIVLLLATLALPGALHDFVHRMPANLLVVQERLPYVWERHVTFLGFWRVLIQGTGIGQTRLIVRMLAALCMGTIAIAMFRSAWRNTRGANDRNGFKRDRLIAATIAATPLLMPFYFDYDQVLLAVPAVLLAMEWISRPANTLLSRSERWIIGLWSIHYVWLMLNPEIAVLTRVNLAVPLWTTTALLLIVRAGWKIEQAVEPTLPSMDEHNAHAEGTEAPIETPALAQTC